MSKTKWEYNETVHQLFIDLKKAYDSVRREVLYNILIEFGVLMKLVKAIKMFLKEAYSKVRVCKHFFFILWRISPMRELMKRGASKQARNRRRTSGYSSLLCNARNSRKSSHASPFSLVATQHRGKSISVAVSRHATIAATFSERSALTVLRVSDSSVYKRVRVEFQ
jgi:hypothetical protein